MLTEFGTFNPAVGFDPNDSSYNMSPMQVLQAYADVCWRVLTCDLIQMTPPTTCCRYRYCRHFVRWWRILRMLTYADVCWRMMTNDDVCCVCWRTTVLTYALIRMAPPTTCRLCRYCRRMVWMMTYADVCCVCWRILCKLCYARYADALLERTYRRASITDRPHAFSVCWRMLTYADVCLTQTTQMTHPRHTDTLTHTWANTWHKSSLYEIQDGVISAPTGMPQMDIPDMDPVPYPSPTLPLPFPYPSPNFPNPSHIFAYDSPTFPHPSRVFLPLLFPYLHPRHDINLDMLIWLSESSLSVWFSEVSLIRDNQGRETVWLSKGLIIKTWKAWLSPDNQDFHHVSPKFFNSPDDSPDQALNRIKI